MRKILYIIAFLISGNSVFSQFYFECNLAYPKVRISNAYDDEKLVNDAWNDDDPNDDIRFKRYTQFEFLVGYNLFNNDTKGGIAVETGYNPFICSPNYNYAQYLNIHGFKTEYIYTFDLHYSGIPMRLRFNSPLKEDVVFYLSAGPELCFLTKAETNSNIYISTSSYDGTIINANTNNQYEAYGYTFKDKFKSYTWCMTTTLGAIFKSKSGIGLNIGFNYSRGLADIEDKEFKDNIGRPVNRFLNYVESSEGKRPATIMQQFFLKCGLVVMLNKKAKNDSTTK